MIRLKSKEEIARMREAGKILYACHRKLERFIRPGVTTLEIDAFVERYLLECGATGEQKGYRGYPYTTCASVNDEICHGFPREQPLKSGDIVTIDMVVNYDGWLADSAWTYAVGAISAEARHLLRVTEQALYAGIEKAVPGNRTGDIAHAIQTLAEAEGLSVVRDFIAHGIGTTIHEEPYFAHYGQRGRGTRLKEGMVITIEPMLNVGSYHCVLDDNGWTARTEDGSLSAQYEHTVAITKDGPLILTGK